MLLINNKIYKLSIVVITNFCFISNVIASQFNIDDHSDQIIVKPIVSSQVQQIEPQNDENAITQSQNLSDVDLEPELVIPEINLKKLQKPVISTYFNINNVNFYIYALGSVILLSLFDLVDAQTNSTHTPAAPATATAATQNANSEQLRENFTLQIITLSLMAAGIVFVAFQKCYGNAITSWGPRYGIIKAACIRNFVIALFCMCCRKADLDAYIISEADIENQMHNIDNPPAQNPPAPPAPHAQPNEPAPEIPAAHPPVPDGQPVEHAPVDVPVHAPEQPAPAAQH